jgi:hypothetical protein
MPKQSSAKAIRSKQSSAYKTTTLNPPTIHALRRLRSWPSKPMKPSEAMMDEAAERIMNRGWSRSSNPICSSCYVQKALNGACGCS